MCVFVFMFIYTTKVRRRSCRAIMYYFICKLSWTSHSHSCVWSLSFGLALWLFHFLCNCSWLTFNKIFDLKIFENNKVCYSITKFDEILILLLTEIFLRGERERRTHVTLPGPPMWRCNSFSFCIVVTESLRIVLILFYAFTYKERGWFTCWVTRPFPIVRW